MEELIRLKKLGYELNKDERIALPEDIKESHEILKKSEPKFEEIELKLKEIEYKSPKNFSRLPWIETLCINDQGSDYLEIDVTQDKKLEEYFYKIAARCTSLGLTKLKTLGIDFSRPSDYFTEMLKSDKLMSKIRSRMVSKLNSNNHNKLNRKTKNSKSIKRKGKHPDKVGIKSKTPSNGIKGKKRESSIDNKKFKGDKKLKSKSGKSKDKVRKSGKSLHKDKKKNKSSKNKRDN